MASKPAAIEVRVEEEAFEEWYQKSENRPITFMIVGRSGSGKSSLINTLLQLEGKEKALVAFSGKSVTTKVRKYSGERNGVAIHIIDTPGLATLDRKEDDELQTIAEMHEVTGSRADVVLFCVSVLPAAKIDEVEVGVIRTLTKAFNSQIWEKAVLVLTFCNHVESLYGADLKTITTQYTDQFNVALKKAGIDSISAKSVMDIERGSSFSGIVAVPAGKLPTDKLAHSENWIASLYMEILKKCDSDVVPQLLQIRGLLSPLMKAAAGGGAGAGIGAGIGAFVGAFLLPGFGSIPGSAFGAAIGGGGGGAATFTSMYEEIFYVIKTNKKVNEIVKNKKIREDYEKILDK